MLRHLNVIIPVLFALLIYIKLLMFLSESDMELRKCKTLDTNQEPYEVVYPKGVLRDTAYIDTIVTHFGNHPGSITWDTAMVNISIEVDTVKNFFWK